MLFLQDGLAGIPSPNDMPNSFIDSPLMFRGCMVIKPYGYAIWEKMQAQLDKMFKETRQII